MNIVQGNLLSLAKESKFDFIAHGCNCKGLMGAGIALSIAKQFPTAKIDLKYRAAMKNLIGDRFEQAMLGTLSLSAVNKVTVLNLYTQIETGADFRLDTGLYPALLKIKEMYAKTGVRIAFPKIGAGIGGGYWPAIVNTINLTLNNYMDVTIVEYVEENKDDNKSKSPRAVPSR